MYYICGLVSDCDLVIFLLPRDKYARERDYIIINLPNWQFYLLVSVSLLEYEKISSPSLKYKMLQP